MEILIFKLIDEQFENIKSQYGDKIAKTDYSDIMINQIQQFF